MMSESSESELVAWLAEQPLPDIDGAPVTLGIGDDMAILRRPGAEVLVTTDMLLDGVHFDRARQDLEAIGRKAVACSLSDCAAMAVEPLAATVSVALPRGWRLEDTQRLYTGMRSVADAFDCPIVGGDTTAWDQRLAIDVTMLGMARSGRRPVRREGARFGDVLLVTGLLGGGLLGGHLSFTPRVREARRLVEVLGDSVHAMIDISDGLAVDLHRLCAASGVGARLDRDRLDAVVSPDARRAAAADGRDAVDHVLTDGEDFELLVALDAAAVETAVDGVTLHRIGDVQARRDVVVRAGDGAVTPLGRGGFEHRT